MTLSEFEKYAKEHGIVPVSTDIYKKMISDSVILSKHKEVLQEIRQEIDAHGIIMEISNGEKIIGENEYIAKEIVLEIIDKHIAEGNYAQ